MLPGAIFDYIWQRDLNLLKLRYAGLISHRREIKNNFLNFAARSNNSWLYLTTICILYLPCKMLSVTIKKFKLYLFFQFHEKETDAGSSVPGTSQLEIAEADAGSSAPRTSQLETAEIDAGSSVSGIPQPATTETGSWFPVTSWHQFDTVVDSMVSSLSFPVEFELPHVMQDSTVLTG